MKDDPIHYKMVFSLNVNLNTPPFVAKGRRRNAICLAELLESLAADLRQMSTVKPGDGYYWPDQSDPRELKRGLGVWGVHEELIK